MFLHPLLVMGHRYVGDVDLRDGLHDILLRRDLGRIEGKRGIIRGSKLDRHGRGRRRYQGARRDRRIVDDIGIGEFRHDGGTHGEIRIPQV